MRFTFTEAVRALQESLDRLIPTKTVKFHNHNFVVEHPSRVRVPGKANPAGTKIARQAEAHAIGKRGRVSL